MDNGGIGYNVKEVIELNYELENCLGMLKNSITQNWPTFISTFRENWVGHDEYAFEDTFSTRLINVYNNCKDVIKSVKIFFNEAIISWSNFQNNVGRQFNSDTIYQGDLGLENEISSNLVDLELPIIEQPDLTNTTKGLVSQGTENNLVNAIDDFSMNIQKAFEVAINQLDAGKAFVGHEQSIALNEFISNLNENIKYVINAIDSFKTITIPELVRAYNEQQSTISMDTKTINSTIDEVVTMNN